MKDGNCYPVMGCRSALTVWHDEMVNQNFMDVSILVL